MGSGYSKLTNEEYETYKKNSISTIELKTLDQLVKTTYTLNNSNNDIYKFLITWNTMIDTIPFASNYFYIPEYNIVDKNLGSYYRSRTRLSKHVQLGGLSQNCYLLLTDHQALLVKICKDIIKNSGVR
jgi:hypothetical protein